MEAKRRIVKSPLPKKLAFTSVIILVFLIGRHIPLPLVDIESYDTLGLNQELLSVASLITGGDFSQVSLFTLGLGPWMSTMIIWGFLGSSKKLNVKKMSQRIADKWKKIIMVMISLVQALGLMSFMTFQKAFLQTNRSFLVLILVFVTITGCFVIMWLSNLNIKFGIGSSSIVILVGLLSTLPNRLSKSFQADLFHSEHLWVYGVIIIFCLLSLVLTVFLERAEYRIPVERVMIHNDFANKSYVPIKLNVAGGMSIMYGMTLLVLPQYLFSALKLIFPESKLLSLLISHFQLSELFGLSAYLIILFLLTIGFALVNVKPDQLTENLQEMGDYIHNVRPGRQTFLFLNKKVKQIGVLGGLYTCFIIGVPLVLGYLYRLDSTISTLPGTTLILATLLFSIFDQVAMLKLNRQYKDVL
ncbi:accessory Sec system protein translocase subunit SecY2 [Streptococcus catagoni]|uniref:accessory Sec system protein translocase subunit SecY2 n=1 Tax=Streptococcus catagoni TaxID=2654874 RepID=UPI001409D679|nr:accessory Sec system protein translocase subunit SecY2 [Streptococcus catagoni]